MANIVNRKANFDYYVEEKFEAGMFDSVSWSGGYQTYNLIYYAIKWPGVE